MICRGFRLRIRRGRAAGDGQRRPPAPRAPPSAAATDAPPSGQIGDAADVAAHAPRDGRPGRRGDDRDDPDDLDDRVRRPGPAPGAHAGEPPGDHQLARRRPASSRPTSQAARPAPPVPSSSGEQEPARQRRELRHRAASARVQRANQRPQRRTAAEAGQRAGRDVAGPVVRRPTAAGRPRPRGWASSAASPGRRPRSCTLPRAVRSTRPSPKSRARPARARQRAAGHVAAGQPDAGDVPVAGRVQGQQARAGVRRRQAAARDLPRVTVKAALTLEGGALGSSTRAAPGRAT